MFADAYPKRRATKGSNAQHGARSQGGGFFPCRCKPPETEALRIRSLRPLPAPSFAVRRSGDIADRSHEQRPAYRCRSLKDCLLRSLHQPFSQNTMQSRPIRAREREIQDSPEECPPIDILHSLLRLKYRCRLARCGFLHFLLLPFHGDRPLLVPHIFAKH